MNDRETITYVNKILQRLDKTERRQDIFEQYISLKNNSIHLNAPVYFADRFEPQNENNFANFGSEKGFLKNLYIEGKIIYPDQLQLGINNDFVIDKLGKIGLHKFNQLDSLSLQNLPSFTIDNVKIGNNLLLNFSIDGDLISNYITIGDLIKFEEFFYSVVEIYPSENSIRINSSSQDAMKFIEIKKGNYINIEIYPSILGIYNHNGTNYFKMNAFGDIFYKSINRQAEINIGGSVNFEKDVTFSENILFNNIDVKSINNTEFPNDSKLVTENSNQVLYNKKIGTDLGLNNNRIYDLQDPVEEKDAVTKRYVDKYLTGLKINGSVKTSSVLNINGRYIQETETFIEENNENLTKIMDGIEISEGDEVLICSQKNRNENGVYIYQANGHFIRRGDFCKKQSIDNIRCYYIYVEYGEKNGRKSFVFNEIENFNWDNGDIIFNTFSQTSDIHIGEGLRRVNGEICLDIDENILGIDNNKVTLNKLDISKIENAYFNINVDNGITINKNKVGLLDELKIGLNIDPDFFYFGENNELKIYKDEININDLLTQLPYVNIGSNLEVNNSIGTTNNFEIVSELFPPELLSVKVNESETNHKNDTEVVYMISSIDESGYLTNLRKSRTYNISKKCRSVYSQINWSNVAHAKKYRVYRKINSLCQYYDVESSENELIDVLVPHNFSKIPWNDCQEPLDVNRTRKVVSKLSAIGDSFFQNTKLGLNTNKPKGNLHIVSDGSTPLIIESNQLKRNRPFIKLSNNVNKFDKTRSPFISGDDGLGTSEVELGKDLKLVTKDESGIVIITNKEDEDINKNEEIGTDAYRLQVMDGGIFSEGEITTEYPNAIGTYQNPVGNNALLFKTGCSSDAVANEAIMQWNRDKLEVLPVQNGKILNRNKIEVKNFCIDHPLDKDKYLLHACIEGPTADVYYRGKVSFERHGNIAIVMLPNWFSALVKIESVTIQMTPIKRFANLYLDIDDLERNQFKIKRENGIGLDLEVFWEVKAERKNAEFPVEPKKNEIEIERMGPYSWTK